MAESTGIWTPVSFFSDGSYGRLTYAQGTIEECQKVIEAYSELYTSDENFRHFAILPVALVEGN